MRTYNAQRPPNKIDLDREYNLLCAFYQVHKCGLSQVGSYYQTRLTVNRSMSRFGQNKIGGPTLVSSPPLKKGLNQT